MALIAIEKLIKHVGCGAVDNAHCCVLCEQIRERLTSLAASVSHQQETLRTALRELYDLMPDVDDDYLLDGAKGEFALKAIRVPGIGAACQKARLALTRAEAAEGQQEPEQEKP